MWGGGWCTILHICCYCTSVIGIFYLSAVVHIENVLNPRNNLFSLSVSLPLCDKASSGTDSDSGSEGVPELEEQQDMGTSQMHSQVNLKNSEI